LLLFLPIYGIFKYNKSVKSIIGTLLPFDLAKTLALLKEEYLAGSSIATS
jgi:hypothetical protein